jgi:hypothetical protein
MLGKALALALVGAIVAVGFAKHRDRIREQQTLAGIASELAGRPVGVRCPNFLRGLIDVRGEAGHVKFDNEGRPANYTDLSPDTCRELRHFGHVDFTCLATNTCGYKEFQAGWAAHTLAHEAFHLRGFADEGVAECYALQNTAFVATRLGLDERTARALQQWVYDRGFRNEPDDYRSPQCYRGGRLDLTPQTTAWP